MSPSTKPNLLVYGATGVTGRRMIDGLLRLDSFSLSIISRKANNSHVARWKSQGVRAHIIDVGAATHDELVAVLKNVDVLVSLIGVEAFDTQAALFKAAKDAHVGRVVPSDFSISCPRGVMRMQDIKLDVRDQIRSLGLPHTFIEMGWWTEVMLPRPVDDKSAWTPLSWRLIGSGDQKVAITDIDRMPEWLTRIVQDPRTLGKVVFVSEDEVTVNEIWELVAQQPGNLALVGKKTVVSEEQITAELNAAQAAFDKEGGSLPTLFGLSVAQYMHTIFVRGVNTLENAKKLGSLDARELYPDVPRTRTSEYVKQWYKNPTPFGYDL